MITIALSRSPRRFRGNGWAEGAFESRVVASVPGENTMTSRLDRHRNKDGAISRKHGNALVGTLRKMYGSSFAAGASDHEKLGRILHKLDETSLTKLVEEHESLQRR
jgi:hypothetical protein